MSVSVSVSVSVRLSVRVGVSVSVSVSECVCVCVCVYVSMCVCLCVRGRGLETCLVGLGIRVNGFSQQSAGTQVCPRQLWSSLAGECTGGWSVSGYAGFERSGYVEPVERSWFWADLPKAQCAFLPWHRQKVVSSQLVQEFDN